MCIRDRLQPFLGGTGEDSGLNRVEHILDTRFRIPELLQMCIRDSIMAVGVIFGIFTNPAYTIPEIWANFSNMHPSNTCLLYTSALWGIDGVWLAVTAAELAALAVSVYMFMTKDQKFHYRHV